MMPTLILPIIEESQIGEARRIGQSLANQLGFNDPSAGKVGIIITELATNLLKHGGGGEIYLQSLQKLGNYGLEIISADRGPGMVDVAACMQDGHSTTGTMGGGLGAIARMSDDFDIDSGVGNGTVIVSRIWQAKPPAMRRHLAIGALLVPYPGESVCGDAWEAHHEEHRTALAVVDGLGHGPGAAEAAQEAVRIFRECHHLTPAEILKRMHLALKKTRGAAAGIAVIDQRKMEVNYCGIGNTVAILAHGDVSHNLISYDGTVGYLAPRFHEHCYPWLPGSALIMHSDGLSSRCRPDCLGSLLRHSPSLLAATILRDCRRGSDDIAVLVAKEEGF